MRGSWWGEHGLLGLQAEELQGPFRSHTASSARPSAPGPRRLSLFSTPLVLGAAPGFFSLKPGSV